MTGGRRILGEGPEFAARQAALLFALAGALALVGLPQQSDRWRELVPIAVADLVVAAVVWVLPWDRWRPGRPLLLAVPAFVILAFSTWAFGGFATGTGPFFVLVFAWSGLHYPVRTSLWLALPALVAYVVPLAVTHQSRQVIGSWVVLLPIALGVSAVIAHQVEHLRRAREELRSMERWRAALTATMAHDVRSPLTAIRAALHLIDRAGDRLPPERRDAILASADRQAGRIQRLAEGLLDVERVDLEGGLRLDREPVPVRAAVAAAVEVLDAEVRIEVPAGLRVDADPQRLEQILVNLVTNALRHGRPPVVVGAAPAGEMVRVDVRDHGTGVPAERRERMFTRYAPGDAAGSVGLGLWIARELARAHGGDVRYEPAEPGARFCVTLPAAAPAEASPQATRADAAPKRS